ncbi:trans-sulfuration enzyme family protein [Cohnella silvisoli]|uniref:Aminotransferase class I/II-fold pyridoxal phosphate-dependent enzyme n=1 Tax=Cohnella silvisoli TaxID=2873699 RepID=A0ABV1KUU4_9BACL|nr:aminotransferase class I/II-fold pyridoxal phosphate-dependent enzyme [Cohnella silvisoli]MCD9023065.1 aminotransferase class I/II-fold pyridoxal phosphate-dependent enzyme [Cohnella silvisoli]
MNGEMNGKPTQGMRMQTMLAHYGEETFHGAVVPPVFMNSLFTARSYDEMKGPGNPFRYSRISNPTTDALEKKLAALDNGEAAKVFASGMAAISTALFHYLRQGDHVVCSYPIYGGTYAILSQWMDRYGISCDFVDFRNPDNIRKAVKPNTKLLLTEGYSTMFMDVFDIRAVIAVAREFGLKSIIDNTCATPSTLKPLDWGFDTVMHSLSKYLSGHSDVIGGAIISDSETICKLTEIEVSLIGASLAPFESWLVNRGLRTFGIRMKQHGQSALQVAQLLANHPKVTRVNFPFLPDHEQHALAVSQMSAPTGLLSFELHGGELSVQRFVDALRIFKIGVSWGGFESLVYATAIGWQHEQVRGTEYEARVEGLVRLSVGLEDTEDLLEDLEHALNEA